MAETAGLCGRLIRRAAAPVLAAAVAASLSHAQTDPEDQLDRFRLWNGCGPADLVVEHLSDAAGEIGLTRDAVTTAARSRLRAVRLYDDEATSYLYVNANVAGSAFGMGIEFRKWVTDDNGQRGYASTWHIGSTGTHGGDAGYILSSIAQDMDHFIKEYMRVNADAC